MSYVKIPLLAGVFKDESPLKAKGYFVDSDRARVSRNGMESTRGYERATTSTFLGICRSIFSWKDNGGLSNTFLGTHLRTYAYQDANLYDTTPATSRGQTSLNFTTTITSAVVTLGWTSHGLVADQKFKLENATVATVGGVTINGTYVVLSVTDANTITFTAAQTATSSAGPTASTCDWTVYLAPGQIDSIGGVGFGTGPFGSGTFGTTSSSTLACRTFSAQNWGEEILFSPRGGAIYSHNPTGDGYATSPTEQVTNGTFTGSAAGWTEGAGWAYGANAETATLSNAALTQSISLRVGCYYLLTFTISAFAAGTMQPSWNSVAIGSAISANGLYRLVFYSSGGGAHNLAFTGTGFSGTIDTVSVMQLNCGTVISGAPTQNNSMIVTPERICMVFGTLDTAGNYKPLRSRWSDQEDYTNWTATSANQAGGHTFAEGGYLVRGMNGRGEVLAFTDTALYGGQYVPDPNIVYSFTLRGANCGLIGFNAAVVTDFGTFWMSPGGEFYVYRGGVPAPLQCPNKRDIYDHLQWVQNDKIVAFSNAATNEVGWLYSDTRDSGIEVSRYILYNYLEDKWAVGTHIRTFWVDKKVEQYPLATNASGQLFFMEKDFSAEGGALSGSLTTGYFDLGDGDTLSLLTSIIPDFDDLQGGLTITVYGRNFPNETPTTYGPYSVNAMTAGISTRIRKREIALKFAWSSSPFFMRLGAVRLDLQPTSVRRVRLA